MDIFQAIILAILQGITEFLPISSSAHLILLPKLLGWQDQGLAFDVAVHVGTLFAVVAFLKPELMKIWPAWFSGWKGMKWSEHGQLGWLVVVATIPVGLVGLLAEDWIELNLRSALVIAVTTVFFAILLWWSDRDAKNNNKQMSALNWRTALFVGVAQAIALIPGTSRSGITMTALLALGYQRVTAAKFSFLLAVPTIALGGLLKTVELVSSDTTVAWDLLSIGIVTSALVAFWCMRWFLVVVDRLGMLPFVIYRFVLSAFILIVMV